MSEADDGRETEDQRLLTDADERTREPIPADIETAGAKLVFLAIRAYEPVHVDDLKALVRMSGLSLYPVLRALHRKGHVTGDGGIYTLT
jgi:hypothetical protein